VARIRFFNMFLLIVFILFISACNGSDDPARAPVRALVSIAVTPNNPGIVVGTTQQFTATGTYSDNTTQDLTASVTWSSSDASVTFGSTPGLATSAIAVSGIVITATDPATGIHGTTTLTVMEAGVLLYFAPGATASNPATCTGSGTITNPYIGFCTPSVSGTVAAYLAPGVYNLTAVSGGVTLPNNWNLYGRTADYSAPVPLASRPVFSGIINLASSTITLNSIAMTGNNPGNAILNIDNTNAALRNADIANTAAGGAGIYVSASVLNFSGTNTIVGNSNGGGTFSQGIYAVNLSIINFASGTTSITGQADVNANYGIYLDSSTINFNGGTVSITGTGAGATNYGIYMFTSVNSSHVNFNGGSVNISAIQGANGYGIYASGSAISPCYINYANSLTGNSITISSNATGSGNYGLFSNDSFSHLWIAGIDITNGTALDSFINFISSTPVTGNAVSWTGAMVVTHSW